MLSTLESNPDELQRDISDIGPEIDDKTESLCKPVIVAVQGNAIAGGFILAYSCDLTSETVTAGEAHAMGLVWKLVPTRELEDTVTRWGIKFSHPGSEFLAMIKQPFSQVMKAEWQSILETDRAIRRDLPGGFCTSEAKERLESFLK